MMQDKLYENRKSIEKVILLIYTIYTLAMTVVAILFDWDSWVIPVIIIGLIICWVVSLQKRKSYRFRAFVVSGLGWLNIIIYGIHFENYFSSLSTMAAMVVLLGLYCIPEIMYISAVGSTFLLFYHAFIIKSINFAEVDEGYLIFLRLISIYVVEYVTYYLITTQLNTNKRLMENIDALNAAERSKDDFVANVSHEIRTPINTICGMSEMLLREELTADVRSEVFDIQTAGRNLLTIVSDILDFSELDSGKLDLVEEPYIITSTLNDVMNMTNAQLNGKKIELIVCCDANIPSGLVGDEQKIRRVIMNLMSNAIKFTEEGCVTISVSARREHYGVNLTVSIKDTGIGMNEIQLEKLFSSFNQVDTKRNRQEGGIGLGLAISQAIVRKMGGFITVKSVLGQGSEFQFVVPQKVVDRTPIVSLKNPDNINVVSYINMEKYTYAAIRDGYETCIRDMVNQLGFQFKMCRNLAELKRRLENSKYSHLVICWEEYCEDREWFEQLAEKMPVMLVMDRENDMDVSDRLLRIYKPLYAVALAAVLNGEQMIRSVDQSVHSGHRFIAPAASILVVDDNMMNIKVVEGLLRPYQIKVFAAYSGKEALEKIEAMNYDFVFMDHMMPEMDGVETMHRIRQKPGKYFQTVPIIALTANAIGGAREMFLAEGFQDFVAKPIELSVLERVLLRYIPETKVTKVTQEQFAVTKKKEEPVQKAQEGFADYEGIDVKQGITYCGGRVEDYLEVAQVYYTTGINKIKEIQEFYLQKDWKNYAILVHAVKSTSQGIGAEKLSEMAKGLEQAGKAGDEGFVASNHQEMMTEYERVLGILGADQRINKEVSQAVFEKSVEGSGAPAAVGEGALEEKNQDACEVSKENLTAVMEELKESLSTYEIEAVDDVIQKMQGLMYQGELLAQLAEPVRKKAEMFDFMGAEEELAGIRERLG